MTSKIIFRHGLLFFLCVLTTVCVHAETEDQRVFWSFDASNGLADNSAQTIKCTKTGRMVITTIGHINFYDGDAFTHIDPVQEDAFPLPKYTGHYHLYFDKFHHLWLKDKYMVTCLDLMTERFIPNVGGVIKDMGMKHQVDDLFGDISSHMWFLSGRTLYGVDIQQEIPVMQTAELQDVDVYNDRQLLQFFANGVVSVFDLQTGRHQFDAAAFDNSDSLRYSHSSVICPDDNIYYQIRNGEQDAVLLSFDITTRQWKRLMATPYHLNNMVVQNGLLYIASEYGYWTYDLKTGKSEHYETLTLTKGRKLLTDVNTIAFDRQGGMWLGTEKRGLLYSKPFKPPFNNYAWGQPEATQYAKMMDHATKTETLPRHVNCTYRDSRGWLWTGTYTGLQMKKTDHAKPRFFTKHDGLMNEMVHSVIEDDNHDVWASTSYGISHLIIRNDEVSHIETFFSQDNVPSESFVNGRAMKLDDGTIVMQSLDHIVTFNPKDFRTDVLQQMVLYPKLIKVTVNGHTIGAGTKINGREIIDRAVTRVKEFRLNYNQNSITMTFSGLNFMRPIQTYYRVRVKGYFSDTQIFSFANSEGRVDKYGMLRLSLTGLAPGKYNVEVQASMSPDNWSQEPFVWIVKVEEPWWRTTGIYVLLGFLLIALAVVNFFYFNRNTRLQMQRNNEESDIIHRVRNYADRCRSLAADILAPYSGDDSEHADADLKQEFVEAMLLIVPYVHEQQDTHITMRELSNLTGLSTTALYDLLSAYLYKSPRQIVTRMKLQKATELLINTDMTIQDIAVKCGFVSPNYFIASFYHLNRKTPVDYRKTAPR